MLLRRSLQRSWLSDHAFCLANSAAVPNPSLLLLEATQGYPQQLD